MCIKSTNFNKNIKATTLFVVFLFVHSWEQRKLGDIGTTFTGLSGKSKEDFGHGNAKFVTYLNVFSNPIASIEQCEKIEIDSKQSQVKYGDVFFTTSSETPEEVGMSSIWLGNQPNIYLNSFCFGYRPTIELDCYYLGFMLRSSSVRGNLILLAQGISRYNISKTKAMDIAIPVPNKDEQSKIGLFFSQLDNLITLHQRESCNKVATVESVFARRNLSKWADSWEQCKLGNVAAKVTEKNKQNRIKETFTNSAEMGVVSQRDFFDHDIAKADKIDGYYIVQENDFIYNPRISVTAPCGPINRNKLGRKGVMSPLYTVFRTNNINPLFLEWYFKSSCWFAYMYFNGDSGARSDRFSIKNELFFDMPIPLPKDDEQWRIGLLLESLNNLVTLHQRKYDKLVAVKKSLLEKMFPADGETVPKIRFKGFSDAWEQRKFEDLYSYASEGGTPDTNNFSFYKDGTIPFVKIEDTENKYIDSTKSHISVEGLNHSSAWLIPAHNILFTNGATVGNVAINRIPVATKQGILGIIPSKQVTVELMFYLLSSTLFQREVKSRMATGTFATIILKNLNQIPVCIPTNKNEQNLITDYLSQLDNLITLHQRQLEKLKNIKSALLEKMFV